MKMYCKIKRPDNAKEQIEKGGKCSNSRKARWK